MWKVNGRQTTDAKWCQSSHCLWQGELKIIKTLEKRFFYSYRKDFGSKLYLFPCKNYSFRLTYFGLWNVIHSNRACFIFSWTIFIVSQICAYFVDNPHNLEIDSFKIAVSEHILLYFKNSNNFFCVHMIMFGTHCVCCSFSTGKHSTYFHRICVFILILR